MRCLLVNYLATIVPGAEAVVLHRLTNEDEFLLVGGGFPDRYMDTDEGGPRLNVSVPSATGPTIPARDVTEIQ